MERAADDEKSGRGAGTGHKLDGARFIVKNFLALTMAYRRAGFLKSKDVDEIIRGDHDHYKDILLPLDIAVAYLGMNENSSDLEGWKYDEDGFRDDLRTFCENARQRLVGQDN